MVSVPPYAMEYTQPGLLEIRATRRQPFTTTALALVIALSVLYCAARSAFKATVAATVAILNAPDWTQIITTRFPLIAGVLLVLLLARFWLHRRPGMVQVTHEGVVVKYYPRLMPRYITRIPRAQIAALRDEPLTTRDGEVGRLLILEGRSGAIFELIRIWGTTTEDRQKFDRISSEIRRVLGGLG